MQGLMAQLSCACFMQAADTWHTPWSQDKKDHCILRYKKALCRQIKKQLETQEQICKMFPCSTDACSLRVRHISGSKP